MLSRFAAEQNKQKQNETKIYCLNLVNRFGGTTRTRHTLHSLAHSHNTDTIERRRKHDQSRVAKSPLDASFLQERSRERERARAREMRENESERVREHARARIVGSVAERGLEGDVTMRSSGFLRRCWRRGTI